MAAVLCDTRGVFDFRYHVASLAAVFLALVVGILVGVGLSGRGFVDDAERSNLEGQITDLRAERDEVRTVLEDAVRRGDALDEVGEDTYPTLVRARLRDRAVGVLFVGPVDAGLSRAIREAVEDAGGTVTRVRALDVPLDDEALEDALSIPGLRELAPLENREELGERLAREFGRGGATPLWDALAPSLVLERDGSSRPPVDGIVLARPAPPQRGPTKDFLSGLYRGLASLDPPAVGVESVSAAARSVPVFRRAGLSTVDHVEEPFGRLATVLLLAGSRPGAYGLEEDAVDGVLPPVPPRPLGG